MTTLQLAVRAAPAEQSSAYDYVHASNEELAARVKDYYVKISAVIPHIIELRERFKKLAPGEQISDCHTWTEFCEKVLHRTDRAIRKAITAGRGMLPEKREQARTQASVPSEAVEADKLSKALQKLEDSFPGALYGIRNKTIKFKITDGKVDLTYWDARSAEAVA